jgi:hypothetical protein
MNKYTAEDARFLFFTEEEAGEISFDENDMYMYFVGHNESFSDEISVSEDCNNEESEKTYAELRTIQKNQNITEIAQLFLN